LKAIQKGRLFGENYEENPCYPEDFEQQYLDEMERAGKLYYVVQDGIRLAIFRQGLVYVGYRSIPAIKKLME